MNFGYRFNDFLSTKFVKILKYCEKNHLFNVNHNFGLFTSILFDTKKTTFERLQYYLE